MVTYLFLLIFLIAAVQFAALPIGRSPGQFRMKAVVYIVVGLIILAGFHLAGWMALVLAVILLLPKTVQDLARLLRHYGSRP